MEKVFSNWLLDIAKYIVTALILSTALSDNIDGWFYYVACFVLVTVVVLLGVYLYRLAEQKEKKKKEEKSQQSNI